MNWKIDKILDSGGLLVKILIILTFISFTLFELFDFNFFRSISVVLLIGSITTPIVILWIPFANRILFFFKIKNNRRLNNIKQALGTFVSDYGPFGLLGLFFLNLCMFFIFVGVFYSMVALLNALINFFEAY